MSKETHSGEYFISSPNKRKIVKKLEERGFTANEEGWKLFFWSKDGWYLHCDQCKHYWIGQNINHVLECIKKGEYDHLIKNK